MRKKIVIFGKAEAGKSTLISHIIPDALNVHHRGRTIALDFGSLSYKGKDLHFFGTPGQLRFDCLRDIIALKADLSLMVFDGSRPLDTEDEKILNEIEVLNLPMLALLNQKPPRQRLSIEEVERLCRSFNGFRGALEGDVTNMRFVNKVLENIIAHL
jgi:hypothetical protein